MIKFKKPASATESIKFVWLLILFIILSTVLSACIDFPTVIDGDTIALHSGEMVRYIGIDTPERDELFYVEAKTYNYLLVTGKRLIMETDITDKDKHGRLLRYVFADGVFVNAELVRKGYALVYSRNKFPDNKYYEILQQAAIEAAHSKLGIWSLPFPHPKLVNYKEDYYIPYTD